MGTIMDQEPLSLSALALNMLGDTNVIIMCILKLAMQ